LDLTEFFFTGDDIDYAWRGIMHSHLKRNKEALADIDQAIKLAPSNSFHYQFRGIIYFGLERYDSAIADFSEAIKLLPNWAGHYVWRAAVQYELEQWNNTATDLDKAVSLRPDEVTISSLPSKFHYREGSTSLFNGFLSYYEVAVNFFFFNLPLSFLTENRAKSNE
jgi:tetratricopeptide (TPR) repeat protein